MREEPSLERFTGGTISANAMHPSFTAEFIEQSVSDKTWDFSNEVLYKLCEVNPQHSDKGIIIAKIWLIGRTYAAAIERRRTKDSYFGDRFYEEKVAPEIRNSPIDEWLHRLTEDKDNNTELSLEIHKELTDLFYKISDLDKRSLASKYLHFHFRKRYFIYDAFASSALISISGKHKRRINNPVSRTIYDTDYANFFHGCQNLNKELHELIGRELLPRELDKCFLTWNRQNNFVKAQST